MEKKAVNEILSLKPNTKHVKEIIERKYGKFDTQILKVMFKKLVDCDAKKCERDNVRGRLRQLVYSKSAEEYEDTKKEV